jgi:TPR repeat protein
LWCQNDRYLYAKRLFLDEDYASAVALMKELSNEGFKDAVFFIGELYYWGKGGVSQDLKEAYQWYQKKC